MRESVVSYCDDWKKLSCDNKFCRKTFFITLGRYKVKVKFGAKNFYCSRDCYYVGERRLIETKCYVCGKKIIRRPCDFRKNAKRRVCSKACVGELLARANRKDKIKITCPGCKKVKYLPPKKASLLKTDFCGECSRHEKMKFPSKEIAHAANTLGVTYKIFKEFEAVLLPFLEGALLYYEFKRRIKDEN